MQEVEQRGPRRKVSIHVRLNEDDQDNLAQIIDSGLADNVSDGIRCALFLGARAARRIIKKRSDA